ncbi:MAG: hypothetical protein QT08_C0016G0012 [archaeon GW2011_AR17]|nr:MAG: hypothetical protein QT08_C0016G0012 [archaeon GW2011_AR17]MBS3154692.1 hypothetical protein [Candidatus Woesearchaeota archaeon]HIH14983.1 hypothetical protein [Nanoarchaeota archaeon]HIH58788.1 hypothetical protein [Nanoarchaeota archaeon]HII13519.1 hypothetical protein [Nanoarchaeota archaeon]
MVQKERFLLGSTASLPFVALLNSTCVSEDYLEQSLFAAASSLDYICPVQSVPSHYLPQEAEDMQISFPHRSWSLEEYRILLDYAKSLEPGMTVTLHGYANSRGGLTEGYAQKRIKSVKLFLERGNSLLDFVPEIHYDASPAEQAQVKIVPGKSRIHEALDQILADYDAVYIEQSTAMQKQGLWIALQTYDFPVPVSLVSSLLPYCGKALEDIEAVGHSVLAEGLAQYLRQEEKQKVLVIHAESSAELSKVLEKDSERLLSLLSLENLERDGIADADTANEN